MMEKFNPMRLVESTKKMVAKSVEGKPETWKNKLSRMFVRTFSGGVVEAKKPEPLSALVELTEEEKLNLAKKQISYLAQRLKDTVRMQMNGQTFWFNAGGAQILNPDVIQQSETLLSSDNISKLTGSTSIDGLNDNIYFVQGVVMGIVDKTKTPLKLNNTWFDIQGDVVNEASFERFEKSFGQPAPRENS